MDNDDITPDERLRCAQLHDVLGLSAAARKLGIGKDSLLRILASSPVHRGTVAVLRMALARLSSEMGA
jgi:hypothetical protein